MKVFLVVLAVRLLCAYYSIIPDCDEVFNYWEPLHYLTHKFGLETWEYSPEYAIRSWGYLAVHAVPVKLASFLFTKQTLFYTLRVVFATTTAWAESRLYKSLCRYVSRGVGRWYLVFSVVSTGMFHASVAFLPSSFAMHCVTLAMSYFVERRVVQGLTWIAVGGLLGWPFALVIAVPFGLEYLLTSPWDNTMLKTAYQTVLNVGCAIASIVAVDSAAYQKLVAVPANIVLYNVINASEQAGPNIFGTEPWWYYIANLLLNFNGIFVLALGSIFTPRTFTVPFWLWAAIFTCQPHKEERFMYVVYQALCVNAAVVLDKIKIGRLRWVAVAGITAVSLLRTLALANYYSAPLTVFGQVAGLGEGNVCVGQEWYRYPSSYFLNDQQRLKFIKSGFDGLLPGEFDEPSWPYGMAKVPPGMNNLNLEDPGKYTPAESCRYLIDTESTWDPIYCTKFLDSAQTRQIDRILYNPLSKRLAYTDYCIYQNPTWSPYYPDQDQHRSIQ